MGLERVSLAKFLFLLKFAIDSSRQRSYGLGREGETGEPDAEAVCAGFVALILIGHNSIVRRNREITCKVVAGEF